ncbi:MAG: cupredoxin domain-containing protein [Canibacter sp.]
MKSVLGRSGLAAVAVLALVFASGCSAQKPEVTLSAEGVEPAATVQAIDNAYEPETVTIQAGEAVEWTMAGSSEHDVVAEDGSFVSELVMTGTFTHVFDEPGEYPYDCSVHPEMTGKVIVTE